MAAVRSMDHLVDQLPTVRGRMTADAPIAAYTWFRVGGRADAFFVPADEEDLRTFLAEKPSDVAHLMLGVGSNLLVRDGGYRGVVVRLGRAFAQIDIDGTQVKAGAMALDYNVAKACREAGVSGFEFLAGVPGTIGGGLRMNAGAYGRELKDVVTAIRALTADGEAIDLDLEDWAPHYRGCATPEDWIFVGATMKGRPGRRADIAASILSIQEAREDTQPIRTRTGGSTFRNEGNRKAWLLVDQAGCRGLRRGGAMVSEKHCNFLVNTGSATAADIEGLGEEVKRRVREATGVDLQWEIRRVGERAGTSTGDG